MDVFEPQVAEGADRRQQVRNLLKDSCYTEYHLESDFGCIGRVSQAQFLLNNRLKRENVTLSQKVSVLQSKLELAEQQREALSTSLNREKMKACNSRVACRSAEAQTDVALFFERAVQTDAGDIAEGARAIEDLARVLEGKYQRVCQEALAEVRRQSLALERLAYENEDLQRRYTRERKLRRALCDGGYVVSSTCVDFELSEEVTSSISYYEDDD